MESQVGSQILEFKWLDDCRATVRLKRALDPNNVTLLLEEGQVIEIHGVSYSVEMFEPRGHGPLVRSGIVTVCG